MASASIPAQPGETISEKYQIEGMLGVGGAGLVVSARHLALGHTCAIKFLSPNAAHNPHDVARFRREMRMAARLTSEHVTRVLDAGELQDGTPYLVLEYLEGQDLGATLRMTGPLPVVQSVGYLLQVCEAVAEAHSIGLVHRDLKPANFFLTHRRDGTPLVKVLDFGIARYLAHGEPQDMALTQNRALLGSPSYMSPEQIRLARAADARSDLWSLGVSLFELLTGSIPFSGETVASMAAAIASDSVPAITKLRSSVPPKLGKVIEKCLEKLPEQRYQTVAELADALLHFGPPEGVISVQRIAGILSLRPHPSAEPDVPSHVHNPSGSHPKTDSIATSSGGPPTPKTQRSRRRQR